MSSWPRSLNVILGIWLFISAFVWPHSQEQMTNTWILGVLAVVFAVFSINTPPIRYLNTFLALWLFISAFALPSPRVSSGTVWNNVIVAILIFIFSLAPGRGTPAPIGRAPA